MEPSRGKEEEVDAARRGHFAHATQVNDRVVNQELPGLLELPSPFLRESGMLRLMESADSPQEDLYERVVGGTYNRPYILEDGALRCLCFSVDNIQSAMRISEPYVLDLSYTQVMMAFLLFNCQPRRIALIGLGGGSIAKYCYRYLPSARIAAVESDPDVIALRDEFSSRATISAFP